MTIVSRRMPDYDCMDGVRHLEARSSITLEVGLGTGLAEEVMLVALVVVDLRPSQP